MCKKIRTATIHLVHFQGGGKAIVHADGFLFIHDQLWFILNHRVNMIVQDWNRLELIEGVMN